jgi:hypothetical protein
MKELESYFSGEEFEPAGRFDSKPLSASWLQTRGIDALEELKQRLLQETAWARSDSGSLTCLRRAAEDAVALAWTTPFPLLVLPELFFEKAAEACARSKRQREIRRRSQGLAGPDN